MGKRKSFTKGLQKKMALKHVHLLFKEANNAKDEALAQRYVDVIRTLSKKFRLKLPREIKRSFCKHCYNVFNSENSRTRLQRSKVVQFCKKCGKFTRIPYIPKVK